MAIDKLQSDVTYYAIGKDTGNIYSFYGHDNVDERSDVTHDELTGEIRDKTGLYNAEIVVRAIANGPVPSHIEESSHLSIETKARGDRSATSSDLIWGPLGIQHESEVRDCDISILMALWMASGFGKLSGGIDMSYGQKIAKEFTRLQEEQKVPPEALRQLAWVLGTAAGGLLIRPNTTLDILNDPGRGGMLIAIGEKHDDGENLMSYAYLSLMDSQPVTVN